MRTSLAVMLAFLPLVQAQDSRLLKSVEPSYDRYSEDLTADFDVANASVTLAIQADGKPFALSSSSIPLPMAVVMALKDYEFQPQGVIPHGQSALGIVTYQVTLNVPVRQSKEPQPSAYRVRPGIMKGNLLKLVAPVYPEAAIHARIQSRVAFEAVIAKQGDIKSLKISNGQFVLMEAVYDAVKQWQYRPYLIMGEPVEVLTEIGSSSN